MLINHKILCEKRWETIKGNPHVSCLELNISEACNYQCEYCIFHRNIKETMLMSPQYAKKVTESFIKYLGDKSGLIYLGAGEPLLNWNAIVQVTEALQSTKNHIALRFMTNASLLTKERLEFLHKNHIGVGFSLDGPPVQQNKSRIAPPGINSYESVLQALEWAKEIGYPVFSLSATYKEPDFADSAKFVMNLCQKYHIPEFDLDYDISSLQDETMNEVANTLIDSYFESLSNNLKMFGYWLIPFINSKTNNNFRTYCDNSTGNSICISANGKVKICGYDPKSYTDFSNFENLFFDPQYRSDIKNYTLRKDNCLNCELFPFCFGQCIFLKDQSTRTRNCSFMKIIFDKLNTKCL